MKSMLPWTGPARRFSVGTMQSWITRKVIAGGFARCRVYVGGLERVELYADGDWIIKGVANEFYPCKNEIFEATYEPEAQGGQIRVVGADNKPHWVDPPPDPAVAEIATRGAL